MQKGFYVACYKGTQRGISGAYNVAVRWWIRSPYSHAELVFSDGMSASSSFSDGGVRIKYIPYDDSKWDYFPLPAHLEADARKWFEARTGQGYDLMGNVRFMFSPLKDGKTKWFCSEAVAASLGIPEPWRFDPALLAAAIRFKNTN